jgi:hypothetical protein
MWPFKRLICILLSVVSIPVMAIDYEEVESKSTSPCNCQWSYQYKKVAPYVSGICFIGYFMVSKQARILRDKSHMDTTRTIYENERGRMVAYQVPDRQKVDRANYYRNRAFDMSAVAIGLAALGAYNLGIAISPRDDGAQVTWNKKF